MKRYAAIVLAALASASCSRAPELGPPDPHAPPAAAAPIELAARYARAAVSPRAKAANVRLVRADAGVPEAQNWEVALVVTQRGAASADDDAVLLAWMEGRPGADGFTETRLVSALSRDGARSVATRYVAGPPGMKIPFDPVLAVDRAAGRVHRGAMSLPGRIAWTESGAIDSPDALAPPVIALATKPQVDKGWLAAGPGPGGTGRALYFAHNAGVQRSDDGGATWSTPTEVAGGVALPQTLVLPDGSFAMAYYHSGSRAVRFVRSRDGARSFDPPVEVHRAAAEPVALGGSVPGEFRTAPFGSLARDPRDGTLYIAVADVTATAGLENDVDVLLFRSDDGGERWSAPRIVPGDAPPRTDQFLPALAVDDRGRLHLAFLDTRRTTAGDLEPAALVDAWYAVSEDGGASFRAQRLEAEPVDSAKTQWSPLSATARNQFVGDYIGLDVSAHAAYVAFPSTIDGAVAMTLARIDLDEAAGVGAPVADPRGLAGAWYDPARSGQGFELQWLEGGVLLAVFYGHRDDGSNLFLIGTRAGAPRYGEALEIPLVATRGGRFTNLDPAAIRREPWGTLTLEFTDCDRAQATLAGADGTQALALVRLAKPAGLDCGAPAP